MSFQAYIDNIEAKTGKTPDDFKKLAAKKGLLKDGTKAGEIVAWLKKDFDLGHGHAMAIYAIFKGMKTPENDSKKITDKSKTKIASAKTAKNIDEYISRQEPKVRVALEKLREIIKSVAPESEEVVSYAMPAFKYHGMLVGFAGWKEHAGFYPWNSRTVAEFKEELKGYETSKGAIQLPLEKPIPVALVKKIVKARMKENIAKESAKKIGTKENKKEG